MADKQVLVLGAGGFVGQRLVRQLVDQGYQVRAAQRSVSQNPLPEVEYVLGDLMDPTYCASLAHSLQTVFYCAAFKKNIRVHTQSPYTSFYKNEAPLMNCLQALTATPPQQLIYVGSVYAEDRLTVTTTSVLDGYALAKRSGESAVLCFAKEYGVKASLVRSAPVYGPGNDTNPETANVVPALLQKCFLADEQIEVWGSGQRQLQFIYVDDLVQNLIEVGQTGADGILTLGNNEIISIDDIAKLAIATSGKSLRLEHDLTKPDKESILYTFKNLVPAKIDMRAGVLNTHKWMSDNNRYG